MESLEDSHVAISHTSPAAEGEEGRASEVHVDTLTIQIIENDVLLNQVEM